MGQPMADLRYQLREPLIYIAALTDRGRDFLRLYDARDKAVRVMPLLEFPFAFEKDRGEELLKLAGEAVTIEEVPFVAPSRVEDRRWIWTY